MIGLAFRSEHGRNRIAAALTDDNDHLALAVLVAGDAWSTGLGKDRVRWGLCLIFVLKCLAEVRQVFIDDLPRGTVLCQRIAL
jgi:hypothetical protein